MKLYAIRDKKTKKPSLLAESPMSLWESFGMAEYALSISCDPQTDEVITLRIEPTEPCMWCEGKIEGEVRTKGESVDTFHPTASNWNFCPMCGRSLT